MARPSQDEIKKQLEDQEDDVYGEEALGGSANSEPMDIDEVRGSIAGEDFNMDVDSDEVNPEETEVDEETAGLGNDDDDDLLGPNPFDEEDN